MAVHLSVRPGTVIPVHRVYIRLAQALLKIIDTAQAVALAHGETLGIPAKQAIRAEQAVSLAAAQEAG